MPFTYIIHPERNLIRQTLWGRVTTADLKSLAQAMWADPLYRRKMDMLVDLREAQADIAYDDMVEYARFLSGSSDIGRQAIVVQRSLEFGVARMYEQLTEHRVGRTGLRVFQDIDPAEAWIARQGESQSP